METTEIRLKCLEIATNVAAPEMLHNSMIREVRRAGSKNDVDDVIEIAGRLYDFVIEKKCDVVGAVPETILKAKKYKHGEYVAVRYNIDQANQIGARGEPIKVMESLGYDVKASHVEPGNYSEIFMGLIVRVIPSLDDDGLTLPTFVTEIIK